MLARHSDHPSFRQADSARQFAGCWRFPSVRSEDRADDNNTQIHFSQLTRPAALVRELAQNSIDGGRSITLPGGAVELVTPVLKFTFRHASWEVLEAIGIRTLAEHYNMCNWPNGSRYHLMEGMPLTILTAEDNGGGLLGAITSLEEGETPSGAQKSLYEVGGSGAHSKRGSDGGRWGMGGETATHSSKIRASLATTTREDEPRMFATGRASLKIRIKGKLKFLALGAFSSPDGEGGSSPCEGSDADFVHDSMGFLRQKEETGLSIAIIDPVDDVTPASLLASAFACVFPQIALGMISVEIHDARVSGSEPVRLTSETISERLREPAIAAILADYAARDEKEFHVLGSVGEAISLLQQADSAPEYRGDLPSSGLIFQDADKDAMRTALDEGAIVRFSAEASTVHTVSGVRTGRIGVAIRKIEGCPGGVDILMRDSIAMISRNDRGRFTLTAARKDGVAECLGDCEDPSHMRFQAVLGKDRGWKAPERLLSTFRNMAGDGVRLLMNTVEHVDKHCLENLFPILGDGRPAPADELKPEVLEGAGGGDPDFGEGGSERDKEEEEFADDRDPGERKEPTRAGDRNLITIEPSETTIGAIWVSLPEGTLDDEEVAEKLVIKVTYAGSTRLFDTNGINVDLSDGCGRLEVTNDGQAEITFRKVTSAFSAHIRGFDPHRNVVVSATLEGYRQ